MNASERSCGKSMEQCVRILILSRRRLQTDCKCQLLKGIVRVSTVFVVNHYILDMQKHNSFRRSYICNDRLLPRIGIPYSNSILVLHLVLFNLLHFVKYSLL